MHRGRTSRTAAALAAATLALSLAGCGDAGPAAGAGATSGAASVAPSTPEAPVPVLDEDFPDPDVLRVGDTYYAYATQRPGPNRNLQMARSTDLRTWELVDQDPLPRLPDWATTGRTWAPDVSAVGDGFVMYFTARSVDPDLQCIGVATASAPTGPFTPVGKGPLICPEAEGGAIDAATYVEPDGKRYLLWKNDGNCCGKDTWLQLQPLSADGLTKQGASRKLVKQDQPWEGNLVEAPTLVRRDNQYTLLYSANDYGGEKYATGYATAARIEGPYTKADQPLLSTEGTDVIGPGGQDVVPGPDGKTYLVFHGWDPAITKRAMYLEELGWKGPVPVPGG